jgi:uncharacterized membrane protein YfcA
MPMLPGRRRRPDDRPIPDHPYRDTALVYAGMGVLLVIVASLTGGQAPRALVAAAIFFVIATAWTWWGFRKRIRARDEAAAAEAARRASQPRAGRANGNGSGRGSGKGGPR